MDSVLDKIIALCTDAKTKLGDYNKYKTTMSLATDSTQSIEERDKMIKSFLDNSTEISTCFESTQKSLESLNSTLAELSTVFASELSQCQNKTYEFNKTVDLMKSIEEEKYKSKLSELSKMTKPDVSKDKNTIKFETFLSQYITPIERQKLEEWTGLKFQKVLFDSEVDNFSQDKSTFGKKISKQQFMCFVVRSENKRTFGGVVYNMINFEQYKDSSVVDPNAFVFNLDGEKSERYLGRGKNIDYALHLEAIDDPNELFSLCGNAIFVQKKGILRGSCAPSIDNMPYGKLCGGDNFKLDKFAVFKLAMI
ncbi:hypothetical protein EIN_149810 [Entamoeba invadens IP1]|uniref:TLDc domain-containing protein n=1 Tax=Entamoeba invadens IP1 TaxID=370355 RepID=A0A0A1U8C4_ENTIV|nr:hypothetical protein EIN_149810 [Entamoeba invadens IP1]ELP91164.1 hypothetical protein EIN_149810 [Entamoeba invadens IP1]|eukprot:XP_004257935.1 hypothetical protein EIN_149810 [Entamoeba invadens IP1]